MNLTRHKLMQGIAIAAAITMAPMKVVFGQMAEFTTLEKYTGALG